MTYPNNDAPLGKPVVLLRDMYFALNNDPKGEYVAIYSGLSVIGLGALIVLGAIAAVVWMVWLALS